MLLPVTDIDEASRLAERIRASIAAASIADVGAITLSVGVAAWQDEAMPLEQSLKQADAALYQAKHDGRNCVRVAEASKSLTP